MGTEIKVWEVRDSALQEIEDDDLAAAHKEKELEEWIEKDPSLLGSKLFVIGRQYEIPDVGRLDLLCIDELGKLVIIEFKRDLTNRETVAQILDYASWLDGSSAEEINSCAESYLGRPLREVFAEKFGTELQSLTLQNHRMLVVAPKLDSGAERIINYLAERHAVDINAVFFRYAKTRSGDEILIRTVLVPDAVRGVSSRIEAPTTSQLVAVASERKISKLVEACRALKDVDEEASAAYKGSFRYWFKGKVILGVNVSGERRHSPAGEVDVWIPVAKLPEVTGVPEIEARQVLTKDFGATESGGTDCVVRLKTEDDATRLIALLQGWLKTPVPEVSS